MEEVMAESDKWNQTWNQIAWCDYLFCLHLVFLVAFYVFIYLFYCNVLKVLSVFLFTLCRVSQGWLSHLSQHVRPLSGVSYGDVICWSLYKRRNKGESLSGNFWMRSSYAFTLKKSLLDYLYIIHQHRKGATISCDIRIRLHCFY